MNMNAFSDAEVIRFKTNICKILINKISISVTMFIAVIIVILSIGFFIIGYLCIRGTYRRNHIHLRPMLVVIAVGIVLSLLELLQLIYTSDVRSIGSTLVGILIYTYEFIVIDSLHDLFREEYDRKHSVQYHSTLQKV